MTEIVYHFDILNTLQNYVGGNNSFDRQPM